MAMTKCVLDGYAYPYNALENQNPKVRAISATDTLEGRVYTDFGSSPSRQDIVQKWPTMDADVFEALQAKAMLGIPLSYTDDDGTIYTVLPTAPTYNNKTPGHDAYINVQFMMYVVSSP